MKNILFISNYPPKGSLHGSHFGGVASYTKNTIKAINNAYNLQNEKVSFTVLADRFNGYNTKLTTTVVSCLECPNGYKNYKEGNVEVKRVWNRNDWFLLDKLLLQVLKTKNTKDIFIAFEFSLFGLNKFITLAFPFFILFLRLFGKNVYLVLHHVLLDINKVDGQLGVTKNSIYSKLYGVVLKLFYKLVCLFASKIVVFEEHLKQDLLGLKISNNKIVTINHGVEKVSTNITKAQARKKLGFSNDDFVVLNFGFIAWYKGSDWLVSAFKSLIDSNQINKNVKLVMAGGFSRNHKDNRVYNKMYEKIEGIADGYYDQIQLTGFVPEDKIQLYFEACDLVVLPYRVMLSASGPFSLVLSYKKPFVLSSNLDGYMLNNDFKQSMQESNVTKKDLFFNLSNSALLNALDTDKKVLENFSKNLAQKRSWDSIGKQYAMLLK